MAPAIPEGLRDNTQKIFPAPTIRLTKIFTQSPHSAPFKYLFYKSHEVAKDRIIKIHPNYHKVIFQSEKKVLSRILGNMIKNALEACNIGETVTIDCAKSTSRVEFRVHNPNFIPADIQLQIFQRSFSTKGSGRGLGTYSIKLLTERYLNGTVSFHTSEAEGTTFTVSYPLG